MKQDKEAVDSKDLAIIITTSPIKSNPATEVIDLAIDTILKEPSLANATIFIVCDGAKVIETGGSKYKSGIINTQSQQDYEGFKIRLKEKYQQQPRIIIEERSKHCGFAQNIKHVMVKIPHEFVLIFQHDHIIVRPIDFSIIINTMKAYPIINYIGIMNRSVFKLAHELDQYMTVRKYFCEKVGYFPTKVRHNHEEFKAKVLEHYEQLYGIPLMPLTFWYDKVHVARKSYYLNTIFHPYGFLDEISNTHIKTISFVEDSFGAFTRKAIHKRPAKFEELNAFIYWDKVQAAIAHTHGRGFLTQQVKQNMYLKGLKQKEASDDQSEQEVDINIQFLNIESKEQTEQ